MKISKLKYENCLNFIFSKKKIILNKSDKYLYINDRYLRVHNIIEEQAQKGQSKIEILNKDENSYNLQKYF